MMQTEGERLTREDKRELEKQIKITEGEIEIRQQRRDEFIEQSEKDDIDLEIIPLVTELRRLRRLRT